VGKETSILLSEQMNSGRSQLRLKNNYGMPSDEENWAGFTFGASM